MPKVTAATVAVTAVLALTLTGCAGSADNAADERTAPASVETDAPVETPEPLVAETPAVEAPEDIDADAKFLTYVRDSLPANTSIPNATDEQLISAGHEACNQIEAGTDPGNVRVVEGEQPNGADIYADSSAIMNAALLSYCPDLL